MAKLPMPDVPRGNLRTLIVELHELHGRAGWPSTREIAKGRKFSHTAVHELFTKTATEAPKLTMLLDVVERLARLTQRMDVDETLDRFDELWKLATQSAFLVRPEIQTGTARGQLLPIYLVVEETMSLTSFIESLNAHLPEFHETLITEPATAEMIRFAIYGFSSRVVDWLPLSDMLSVTSLPRLLTDGAAAYAPIFEVLRHVLHQDIKSLRQENFQVHRPIVVFVSSGAPVDFEWRHAHRQLTNRLVTPFAPTLVAIGLAGAESSPVISELASHPDLAYVSTSEMTDQARSILQFCLGMIRSLMNTRSVTDRSTLIVDQPDGFRHAAPRE